MHSNESIICVDCDCVICKIYFCVCLLNDFEVFTLVYSSTMELLSNTFQTILTSLIVLNTFIIIQTTIIISFFWTMTFSTIRIIKLQSQQLTFSQSLNVTETNILQTEYRNGYKIMQCPVGQITFMQFCLHKPIFHCNVSL